MPHQNINIKSVYTRQTWKPRLAWMIGGEQIKGNQENDYYLTQDD